MEPPKNSKWKQQGIKMGFRPEVADYIFEAAKVVSTDFLTGIALAVLTSMFADDAFGSAFLLYIFGQHDLSVRICYEFFYLLTYDGFLGEGMTQVPVLTRIFWPVTGYVFGAMTIRTVEFILWILGALLRLFLLFSAFISVLDLAIGEMLIGLPHNPWPFLALLIELPWDSNLDHIRELRAHLRDLYKNLIHKRLLNLWNFYKNHIHRRLLLFGIRVIETDIKVLKLYYRGFQWLKQLVRSPTFVFCIQVTWDSIEFGRGLLITPEMHTLMYHYKPLGDKDIRLLRLTRKGLFGGVKRTLIHVPLSKSPAYECISYVWGDSIKTHSILIDGCQLPVTTTAYSVLRERGSIWSSRLLWIDAVCINQSDNEEKSRQVRQMQTIYKSADRVTIYLGSPPDAHLAIRLLAKLVLTMRSYRPSEQWQPILGSYMRHQENNGGAAPEEWVAFRRLLSNPWFERAWVVQEVTMATNLYMLYGGKYLDWATLMSVMAAFSPPDATMLRTLITRVDENHLGTMPNGIMNGINMGGFRQQFRAGETLKLHKILRFCLTFHATEPIDKIFAVQGISEEGSHPLLPIDYSLKVPDVLMNTARYFLQTRQSLQMLQLAGVGWERDHKNIPSWVTDWTMTRPSYMLSLSNLNDSPTAFKAATQIPPHIQHDQMKSSLEMKGLYFDEIDEVGDCIHNIIHNESAVDLRNLNLTWLSWFRRAEDVTLRKVPDPYHNGQSRLEAFWRSIITDRDTSRPASPDNYFNYLVFKENCMKKVVQALKGKSSEVDILTESERKFLRDRVKDPRPQNSAILGGWAFSNAIGTACNDRRFAVTRKGYLAMVPLLAESGDIVCLVFGAEVPFILRKIPLQKSRERFGERQCYALVGESYVHGIMDGEGLGYLTRMESCHAVEDFMVL